MGFTKKQYIGGLSKKGAWTVCRFKGGGLGKKEGGSVFEGEVDIPMHTTHENSKIRQESQITTS